jgi:hypothetical protein
MLTSYRVTCPHAGCGWIGSLLPQTDTQAFRGAVVAAKVVVFQCPKCDKQWRARVVGDDVVTLPLESREKALA